MERRQLEQVLAVVDHGSFTAAAAALFVTQPTLSHGVAALERELGVALFERTGRGVRLSAAGEAFVPSARRALQELRTAGDAARAVLGLQAGHLRLVSLPTLIVEPLVGWIGAFRQAHPKISVEVREAEEARRVPGAVRDGDADLGLAELEGDTDDLVVVHRFTQDLVAACPPGTPQRNTMTIAELAELPQVVTPRGTSMRRLSDAAFEHADVVPSIAIEIDQREALVPLVLAGVGASLVPERLARAAADDGAVVIRPDPPLRRDVGLVRRASQTAPAVEAFVAMATSSSDGDRRQRPPTGRSGCRG